MMTVGFAIDDPQRESVCLTHNHTLGGTLSEARSAGDDSIPIVRPPGAGLVAGRISVAKWRRSREERLLPAGAGRRLSGRTAHLVRAPGTGGGRLLIARHGPGLFRQGLI